MDNADTYKEGCPVVTVHIAQCSDEEAARNRLALEGVLRRLGYTMEGAE